MSRTALVTGASSGIGLASAVRLANEGWRVFGGVRNDEHADMLRQRGVEPVVLDVTEGQQVAAAAAAIGPDLNGLVDNAGIAGAARSRFSGRTPPPSTRSRRSQTSSAWSSPRGASPWRSSSPRA